MRSLESAIQSIDNQIENMYVHESLQKHEYQLHAVMVHEGSIDSGHYWAYVLDHKRKVIKMIIENVPLTNYNALKMRFFFFVDVVLTDGQGIYPITI